MNIIVDNIAEANEFLRSGRVEDALERLTALAEMIETNQQGIEDTDKIKFYLLRISELAAAVDEGVRQAEQKFKEIIKQSTTITAYDCHGASKEQTISDRTLSKF